MITLMALAEVARTPVRCNSSTVGTGDPLAFGEVTLKGSIWHPDTAGFVTLQMTARPLGPLVLVSMSGCAATIAMLPANHGAIVVDYERIDSVWKTARHHERNRGRTH